MSGGRGTIWGPIIGTVVLALVDEGFRDLAAWRNTTYAAVLIVILLALPEGLSDGVASLKSRVLGPKKSEG